MKINVKRSWKINERFLLAVIILIAVVVLINPNQDLGSTTSLLNPESQGLFSFLEGPLDDISNILTGAAISVGSVEDDTPPPNEVDTSLAASNLGIMAAPTISNLVLNATDANNKTNQNLTAYWSVSDGDGDTVKNITNWFVNGTSITVLNMPFENHSLASTNATDYSGYGNNGTVIGATFNASGGYGGFGAYEFGGGSDMINLTTKPLDGIARGSVAAWVRFNTVGVTHYLFQSSENDGTDYIAMWMGGDGIFDFNLKRNNVNALTSITGLNVDTWYFIAGTWNSTNITLFLNGELNSSIASNSNTSTLNSNLRSAIGRGTSAFDGTISSFQIFNRSLSPEQIRAIYNNRTDLIVSQETSVGENWSVEVTPNDGTEDGVSVMSSNITILSNTAPVVSNLVLNSTDVTLNDTYQNLRLTGQ